MKTTKATIQKYLNNLQKEYDSDIRGCQHTAELSYRTILDSLFKDLTAIFCASSADVILEPKSQNGFGRPDWRIHEKKTLGIFGFIEGKGLSFNDFNIDPYKNQIERYLTLEQNLIITDGIDFVFCLKGKEPQRIPLVDKSRLKNSKWSNLAINPLFENYFANFLSKPSAQLCDESKLVEYIAIRAKILAEDIYKFAEIPLEESINTDEHQAIMLLNELRYFIYRHDDKNLRTNKVFADFVSQVIMFSLLYAHRVICNNSDTPPTKEKKIVAYIYSDNAKEESLVPFRNLMVFLRNRMSKTIFISQWIDDNIKFLSFVRMTKKNIVNPDFHKLFELFLSKYDNETRFDYGAFYTPRELAHFIVSLTEYIINKKFDGISLYDRNSTTIDPCCGTCSFLEEIVKNDPSNSKYTICGFEILPAPYMLANYRMSLVSKKLNKDKFHLNLVLTNTLGDNVLGAPFENNSLEKNECQRALELSQRPLKLIIGNPPCSDLTRKYDPEEFSIINQLMEDFRPPAERRHSRQNTQKQISNAFMLFIRWACEKLELSKSHTVLSYVVPLSFLEAESFRYARLYLTKHFTSATIVAIDADGRTGIRSNSLFHTLQGRACIILTKEYGSIGGFDSFSYFDITQLSFSDKNILMMSELDVIVSNFKTYNIPENTCSFLPVIPFDKELYNLFCPICDSENSVFLNHCSGIKLAPTALFTHKKSAILKRRCRDIANNDVSISKKWFEGQQRKPSDEKIEALKTAIADYNSEQLSNILNQNIKLMSFRPFLNTNVLLMEDLLKRYSHIGGGGTRLRKEIITAYNDEFTIGFALAHAPKDLNATLSQFTSFCWYYPDNDMCTRGNSHVYMNQYPDSEGNLICNINERVLHKLITWFGTDIKDLSRKMVFYSYAILCSQAYLDEFKGALFISNQSDQRARVPIVDDAKIFLRLSRLGGILAEIEKEDYEPKNALNFDYDSIIDSLPANFKLENSINPFDEQKECIILSDGSTIISIPCPTSIQKLNISGYDVVKNVWLKFNSYDLTHCCFTKNDLKRLLDLLNKLYLRERIVRLIDLYMVQIISRKVQLFSLNE